MNTRPAPPRPPARLAGIARRATSLALLAALAGCAGHDPWRVALPPPALLPAPAAPAAAPTAESTTASASPAPAARLPSGADSRPAAVALQVWALTEDQHLIRFSADAPQQVTARRPVRGLAAGEKLVGIDFRVARGQLYGLSNQGRLVQIEPATGQLSPVGDRPLGWPLLGRHIGIDFNPVADRLRVVTEAGQNLRVHPDTGAMIDFDAQAPGLQADPALAYGEGDALAGQTPRIVAAGYTYNGSNDKLTTNYAIDLDRGLLVMQGSHENASPVVSPNTGRLRSVGPLGVPGLLAADLDISDTGNVPLAALRTDRTRLYRIDLDRGTATLIGPIGDGAPLRALAIEP